MQAESYETAVEKLFFNLEEKLMLAQPELDWDLHEGILTVTFEDESQLVMTRQTALQEVWMASKLGAHHFQWREQRWQNQQGDVLEAMLKNIFDHYHVQVSL